MKFREIGRIAGILGATLTFFVGIISTVLGLMSSSPEQDGGSLVVRGVVVVGLSAVAGYGVSLSGRRPQVASIYLVAVAVIGSAVAFRSFWIAAAALLIASAIIYSGREK